MDEAAALLGVNRAATIDEIRFAFRSRVKGESRNGTFPIRVEPRRMSARSA